MDINHSDIYKIWHKTLGKLSHDLINKLATIRAKNIFIDKLTGKLRHGYDLAVEHKLIEPSLRANEIEYLKTAIDLDLEVKPALDLLEVLNTFSEKLTTHQKIPVGTCIQELLNTYPFENNDKDSVTLMLEYDFDIMISPLFIDAIITQFLYTAFNNVKPEDRKDIVISSSREGEGHLLRCKLDATDIKATEFNYLNEQCIITCLNKILPGIQFCKLAFFNIHGDLDLHLQEGQYLEIIMKFPVIF